MKATSKSSKKSTKSSSKTTKASKAKIGKRLAKINSSEITGFTPSQRSFAKTCFAKGWTAKETFAAMSKKGYKNLPTHQAVSWAYIGYKANKTYGSRSK